MKKHLMLLLALLGISLCITAQPTSDGAVIKGSGPNVYLVQGGQRCHIPDPTTLEVFGGWNAVKTISDNELNAIPEGAPLPTLTNGDFIKGSGPGVYLIQPGEGELKKSPFSNNTINAPLPPGMPVRPVPSVRRLVPDMATLLCMDDKAGERLKVIADATLLIIKEGTPLPSRSDGAILKGSGPAVYFLEGCRRRHIADAQTLNALGGWSLVKYISDEGLNAIPEGAPIQGLTAGDLIRGTGPGIYLLEGGQKRGFPNLATLLCFDKQAGEKVRNISEAILMAIPDGSPIPSRQDGAVLKGSGDKVFLIENCHRRHIPSPEVLEILGGWEAVQFAFDSDLALIPEGSPVDRNTAKENKCFQYFDEAAIGRNDVNAYLLSYLSRIVYVDYLNKDNNYGLAPTDTTGFKQKFKERTTHFFDNPQYEWIWRSDGEGKNPEAMLISSPEAVFVIFRGTDRVEGGRKGVLGGDFEWGEWIYTDFNILPQKPCSNCDVAVHQGFYESLHFAGFYSHLVGAIRNAGGERKKVWVTGHSLGGGMAQLFAYLLKKVENIETQGVYVYSSPHPGDERFAAEMNAIFTGQRVQRFEFVDDPVTSGPPQFLNWIPNNPIYSMKWGRAGTRNWFSKETDGGFNFGIGEKQAHEDLALLDGLGTFFWGRFCYHHPTWLTRGLYNLLPRELQARLPDPPARITADDEGCNDLSVNSGTSGNPLDQGTDEVTPGIYQLRNTGSGRFLQSTNACGVINLNGCCDLLQTPSSAGQAVRWQLSKVENAFFESYTITSLMNNKVVDADAASTGSDECKVHLCGRLPIAVPLRTNQEWKLERLPNGNYNIKCVAGGKYLRVAPGCLSSDGCRFELHKDLSFASEWQLIKVG